MSHIFFTYSRRDIDFAGKIVQALAENALDTWIDWKSIPKGEEWEVEIYRAIETADVFIYLISPSSVVSQWCNNELTHALKNGKRILPVLIVDTDPASIPPEISRRNWIFCRDDEESFDKAIEEISNTIHTDYEWLRYHTELQTKALIWARNKDNSRFLRGRELADAEERLAYIKNIVDPQPTQIQKEFILLSRRQEEKARRNITIILTLNIGILLSLTLVIWYLYRRLLALGEGSGNNPAGMDVFIVFLLIIGVVFGAIGVMFYAFNSIARYRDSSARKESEEPGFSISVFLCHSSKDKPKVRQYYDQLKNEKGVDPWLDAEKLLPGVDWDLEIRSAVRSSDVVLVFLSKYSVNKEGYIQKEIKQALDVADEKPDGTIFIIPLRLEDCEVPERLKRWHWLDLYETDSYGKLLTSLRKRANDLAAKNIGVQ